MQGYHGNRKESTKGGPSIDMLPEVALLKIFDFYMDEAKIEAWCTLVHVCQTWRSLVFRSPRRLNLRLHCQARTPVEDMMGVWPRLPIVVEVSAFEMRVDNIVPALEHSDRVCEIQISLCNVPISQAEEVMAAMQQPFPALTCLGFRLPKRGAPVVPDSFLGGSVPRLQSLDMSDVSFPALPNSLLSATHLVRIDLWQIPHSGYFSPEALATGLSALTRLETIFIEFESPQSCPDGMCRPPLTLTLLPVLTDLQFKGVSNYLEHFVAQIDAPLLQTLTLTYFHRLVYDTPQLNQLISRADTVQQIDYSPGWEFRTRLAYF